MAHKDRDRGSIRYFEERKGALKTERQSFIPHYKDLSQFINVRRGRFTLTDRNKGNPRYSNIINSRATQAHRIAVAGLFAGIMSPSRPWHQFRIVEDPELIEFGPVKQWIHDVVEDQREIFNRTNLYNMSPIMFGELLTFGTGCMTHVDDFNTLARFYTHTVGSYMLAQNEKFIVDTLVREYEMTTDQLVSEFGEKVSQGVKTAFDAGNYETWWPVVQFIEPSPNRDGSRFSRNSKAWRSVKYEPQNVQRAQNDKRFLSEKGFSRFPAYTPRWEVTGEDIYATNSPGMVALGDIKGLQLEERRKAQGIDKMVNPPLTGPSTLKGMNIEGVPGGITLYDTGGGEAKLEPLYRVEPKVQELVADIERVERRIDEAFYVNLFLAISNMEGIQPKNELELSQRNAERLLQLGPVLERLQGEDFLESLINRIFEQQVEAGILLPPPPELEGMTLKVEFISSIASAQKAVAVGAIDDTAAYVSGLVQAGFVDAGDKFDADQSIDKRAELIGTPPSLIVPDDQVAEIRKARREAEAEALQVQQQMEAVKVGAGAIKDVGSLAGASDGTGTAV